MRTWWLVLLLGCGDNLAGDVDGARSGSRLVIGWYEFADGARHWRPYEGSEFRETRTASSEVYYDRVLDLPCTAEPWLDGVTRCTPAVEINQQKVFIDPQCSQRVTQYPDMFELVSDYDPKCGLDRLWHVYGITHKIAPVPLYSIAGDGRCYPSSTGVQRELGVLGPELAPETFVALDTTTSDDADQRIQVRYHESGDGMRLPVGLHDTLLGPARLERDVAMPTWLGGVSPYATDPSCERPLVPVQPGCAPPVSVYYGGSYHRVGARVSTALLYEQLGETCVQAMPAPGDYYEIDVQPYPLADMVTAPEIVEGQRIAILRAFTGAREVRARELYDTQLGTQCTMREFPDGVPRCAPSVQGADLRTNAFSDPQCQTAIDLVQDYRIALEPPRYVMRDNSLFDGTIRIVEVGERHLDAAYSDNFGCEPIQFSRLYKVQRDLDWSELASATIVTE